MPDSASPQQHPEIRTDSGPRSARPPYAARKATRSKGTASLKLDSDPLGSLPKLLILDGQSVSLLPVATLLPRRATPARESGPPHPVGPGAHSASSSRLSS